MRVTLYGAILSVAVSLSPACGGGSQPANEESRSTAPSTDGRPVSLDKNAYPVFPNADSGADSAVTAEQVKAAAEKYVVPDKLIVVAVGDQSKIGPELGKLQLGAVEVRTADGNLAVPANVR